MKRTVIALATIALLAGAVHADETSIEHKIGSSAADLATWKKYRCEGRVGHIKTDVEGNVLLRIPELRKNRDFLNGFKSTLDKYYADNAKGADVCVILLAANPTLFFSDAGEP